MAGTKDKNGEMVGMEFHRMREGSMRVRIVYAGGTVTHIVPAALARFFGRDASKLSRFLREGKMRSFRLGEWAGPE